MGLINPYRDAGSIPATVTNILKVGEMVMKDPYQKVFEDISKALAKHSEMIVWIAKRTLSAKEFSEFIDEFAEKTDRDEMIDFIKNEGR